MRQRTRTIGQCVIALAHDAHDLLRAAEACLAHVLERELDDTRSKKIEGLYDVLGLGEQIASLALQIALTAPDTYLGDPGVEATGMDSSHSPAGRGPARVLLVEDDAPTALFLKRLLRDSEVVVLRTGAEALDRMRRGERFDLVLCEMSLSAMPGHELHANVVRNAPEMADRFVFMDSSARSESADAYLATTRCRVIQKPFESAKLLELVELARRANSREREESP